MGKVQNHTQIKKMTSIVLDDGIAYGEIHKIKKEPNSFHIFDLVERFTEYGK